MAVLVDVAEARRWEVGKMVSLFSIISEARFVFYERLLPSVNRLV